MVYRFNRVSALTGGMLVTTMFFSLAWADPPATITTEEAIAGPRSATSDVMSDPAPHDATTAHPSTQNIESSSLGMRVVSAASRYMGTPYRWGGTSPHTGFDCSGFVQFVFREALNIKLPRLPVQMSRLGERIPREALESGDLVFFNTRGGPFTHVGIYLNDAQFIHAPMPGTRVTVSRMDSVYYRHRFTYAVRIRNE